MKLGILGTGKIVRMAMPALAELKPEKVYLLSREKSREKAEEMCRDNGWDGVYVDYDELLSADIDTVYVALPNLLHYEYTKKALLAGKHAIVEKPIVVRSSEMTELRQLAAERGLCLMEAMTVHHLPAYQTLREQLGRIGRPRLALLNFSQRSSRYDDYLRGIIHPVFDPKQGGGALLDLNVYNIHALLGLFGVPKSWDYRANVKDGLDTSGVLTLDYGDFLAVAAAAKDCQGANGASIQGEDGFIRVDSPLSAVTTFTFRGKDGAEETVEPDQGVRMYYEFAAFQTAMETGEREELERLLDISQASTDILEQCRRQVGVFYPGDQM